MGLHIPDLPTWTMEADIPWGANFQLVHAEKEKNHAAERGPRTFSPGGSRKVTSMDMIQSRRNSARRIFRPAVRRRAFLCKSAFSSKYACLFWRCFASFSVMPSLPYMLCAPCLFSCDLVLAAQSGYERRSVFRWNGVRIPENGIAAKRLIRHEPVIPGIGTDFFLIQIVLPLCVSCFPIRQFDSVGFPGDAAGRIQLDIIKVGSAVPMVILKEQGSVLEDFKGMGQAVIPKGDGPVLVRVDPAAREGGYNFKAAVSVLPDNAEGPVQAGRLR